MDIKELEALKLLHCSPIDENGGVLGAPFSGSAEDGFKGPAV